MLTFLAADTQGRGFMDFFVLMVPIFVIMYLLLIRPQRKQEKARQAMIAAVTKNDRIMTNGGIHGVVTNVKDDEVTIRVDDARDVKIRVSRNFIAAVLNRKEEE